MISDALDSSRASFFWGRPAWRTKKLTEQIPVSHILICRQVFREKAEVSLQLQLMEVEFSSLQKAILEIVQVEEHTVHIEFRLRIAVGEVQSSCPMNLDIRQFTDGTLQQFLFLQRITASSLTSASDSIKEGSRAKVGLDIPQQVVTFGKYLRYRKFPLVEVLSEIDKSVIFVTAGADDADHALALRISYPKVGAVATRSRKLLNVSGFCSAPLLIEF